MPRSTDIRKYGDEWWNLSETVVHAYRSQGTIKIPFSDTAEARKRRLEIYSWIKAMKNERARIHAAEHKMWANLLKENAKIGRDSGLAPWDKLDRYINAFQRMVFTQRDNFIMIVPTGETESSKAWSAALSQAEVSGGVDPKALLEELRNKPADLTPPDLSTNSPYDDIFEEAHPGNFEDGKP